MYFRPRRHSSRLGPEVAQILPAVKPATPDCELLDWEVEEQVVAYFQDMDMI